MISVVTSLYRSQSYIEECVRRLKIALEKTGENFEIILVDDGSPDDSLEKVKQLASADPRVKVIELSRNFGAAKARWTGLAHAKGEYVFMLDADLEEEPELVFDFYKQLVASPEIDVIYGYTVGRKGKFLERLSGQWFYKLFSMMSGLKIEHNSVWARLMRRNYTDALLSFGEFHLVAIGVWHYVGFKQLGVEIEKKSRGATSYSWGKRTAQAFDAIISFSNKPLRWLSMMGIAFVVCSLCFIAYVVLRQLIYHNLAAGWPSIIAAVVLMGGLNLFALGAIGMYLGRVYEQVKGRPNSIVRNTWNI